jgi:NAD(P)-dependent dehydrogenase (short-subunit alcohol dehydrogenase family)
MKGSSPKKAAIITGGSRGIGLAMVRAFKAQGYWVASCARRVSEELASLADVSLPCDLSQAGAAANFIAAVVKQAPKIRVVINNAGIAGENSLADTDDTRWNDILSTNLQAPYLISKACLPYLEEGQGRIINITSVLAHKGVPGCTAYCTAKHGLLGFTRALALDLAPRRITVNAISPGWVRTAMAASRARELHTRLEDLPQGIPLGQLIEPEEIAELAVYLASSAACSITGQDFTIDGGFLA